MRQYVSDRHRHAHELQLRTTLHSMDGIGVNAGVCQAPAGQHSQPGCRMAVPPPQTSVFSPSWAGAFWQTVVLPWAEVRGSLEIKCFVTEF